MAALPAGAAADGAVGNICLEHGLPVYLYQHSNGRRYSPCTVQSPPGAPSLAPIGENKMNILSLFKELYLLN